VGIALGITWLVPLFWDGFATATDAGAAGTTTR